MMKVCKTCGAQMNDNVVFCRVCGTPYNAEEAYGEGTTVLGDDGSAYGEGTTVLGNDGSAYGEGTTVLGNDGSAFGESTIILEEERKPFEEATAGFAQGGIGYSGTPFPGNGNGATVTDARQQYQGAPQYQTPPMNQGAAPYSPPAAAQGQQNTFAPPAKKKNGKKLAIIIPCAVLAVIIAVVAIAAGGNRSGGGDTYDNYDTGDSGYSQDTESDFDFTEDTTQAPPAQSPLETAKQYSAAAVEYNGHAYAIFNFKKEGLSDYYECEEFCEQRGGHLAVIESQEENDFLFKLMRDSGLHVAFFGYTDLEEEGNWTWVNGGGSGYTNWAEGQPNNGANNDSAANEDYAEFFKDTNNGQWNDALFGVNTYHFFCEWE